MPESVPPCPSNAGVLPAGSTNGSGGEARSAEIYRGPARNPRLTLPFVRPRVLPAEPRETEGSPTRSPSQESSQPGTRPI